MNLDDIPKVDSLEALELNLAEIRKSGGTINPALVEFIDNVYELSLIHI